MSNHNLSRTSRSRMAAGIVAALILSLPAATLGKQFEAWGPASVEAAVNSSAPDGCPIESPDGRSLYIASTRSGTLGGNDIWVAHRTNDASPWSAPENLGAPVNSGFNDYCPTPLNGNWLLSVERNHCTSARSRSSTPAASCVSRRLTCDARTPPNNQINRSKKWMPMLVTMPPERSTWPFQDVSYQEPRAVM